MWYQPETAAVIILKLIPSPDPLAQTDPEDVSANVLCIQIT